MQIPLKQIETILEEELFLSPYNGQMNFLPVDFIDWASGAGLQATISNIKNWDDFEYGRLDLSADDFWNLILGEKLYKQDSPILFISDESLKKKTGFNFELSAIDTFTRFYEETFTCAFFQPQDYIVYIRAHQSLKIIHHDGKLITITKQ